MQMGQVKRRLSNDGGYSESNLPVWLNFYFIYKSYLSENEKFLIFSNKKKDDFFII